MKLTDFNTVSHKAAVQMAGCYNYPSQSTGGVNCFTNF